MLSLNEWVWVICLSSYPKDGHFQTHQLENTRTEEENQMRPRAL